MNTKWQISILIICSILSIPLASPAENTSPVEKPGATDTPTSDLRKIYETSSINKQQILQMILGPVQNLINDLLSAACSLGAPATALLDGLRVAVIENLIPLVQELSSSLPQLSVPLLVVEFALNATNSLLSNVTNVVSDYGCNFTSSISTILGYLLAGILSIA